MQKDDMHSFEVLGMTPPKGRLGHSVPTPKPLGGENSLSSVGGGISSTNQLFAPKLESWPTTDLQQSGSSSSSNSVSPAQFYAHRDHVMGGSLSKLDRIRNHQDSLFMEAFDETEEYDSSNSRDLSGPNVKGNSNNLEASRRTGTGLMGHNTNISLDKLTGDSLLFFSYSAASGGSSLNSDLLGGSFVRAFTQGLNTSLSVPYLQSTSPAPGGGAASNSGDQFHIFPTAARNPNKAIITIDAQTSRILIANEMTCELFGYQRNELVGMKIQNLFTEPYRGKQRALVEQNISASGETVVISGKVMDAVTSLGLEFPVSVWMRRVDVYTTPMNSGVQAPFTPRVIVVIEPVERSSALFSINASHMIASCDPWFACLFGFHDSAEVIGRDVRDLVPSLKLPSTLEETSKMPSKQAVTGRTKGGVVFPLTIKFTDVSQSLSIGDLYSPSSHQPSELSSTQGTDGSGCVGGNEKNDEIKETASPSNLTLSALSLLPSEPTSGELLSPPDPPTSELLPSSDTTSLTFSGPSPLTLSPAEQGYISAKVIVYAALSGMISFFPDGTIHGCNHHFAVMLFGYTQQELLKKDVTFLLPDFYHYVGYVDNMPLPPLDEEDCLFHSVAEERSMSPNKASDYLNSVHGNSNILSSPHKRSQLSPRTPQTPPCPHIAEKVSEEGMATLDDDQGLIPVSSLVTANNDEPLKTLDHSSSCDLDYMSHDHHSEDNIPSALSINSSESVLPPVPNRLIPSQSTERIMDILNQRGLGVKPEGEKEQAPLSSTPAAKSQENLKSRKSSMFDNSQEFDHSSLASLLSIPDGTFLGDARHKDGSLMAVVFQLKRITLTDGQEIYCMWLSRDLDVERARTADLSMSMSRPIPDPYRHSLIISPEVDLSDNMEDTDGIPAHHNSSVPHTPSLPQHSEEIVAMCGEYSLNYDTLRPVGKGAFGFVKLAQKKDDKSLVIVKFLRKSSVLKDCWTTDREMGLVPLEIALLARLTHDNIVQLLEAYENEHFFQMVMEKHGEGLDLFEFIERSPRLNEQHISYIFRQMVAAVAYLHGNNIVHRDIKDENIIIAQDFNVKLIDFGSAAYMAPGKLFNTFCGTLEYCSPEVLLGNSYLGPELEMWAVGVTLYTLVFGENPFFEVEETISGHLKPPFLTSPALMKVLFWLLHPDPRSRATIRDLQKDKWTNQHVDPSQCTFDVVLGHVTNADEGGASCHTHKGPVKCNSEGEAVKLLQRANHRFVMAEGGGGGLG